MSEEDKLPVDVTEPMATQSRQALMIAHEAGWLSYRRPYNLAFPDQLEALREELGTDTALPTDGGVYYLVSINTSESGWCRFLVPEGDVRAFVYGIAAVYGPDAARRVQYRAGVVPA